MNSRNALQFATWMRARHPKLYKAAKLHADKTVGRRGRRRRRRGSRAPLVIQKQKPTIGPSWYRPATTPVQLRGLGAENTTEKEGWLSKFMGFVGSAGSTYLSLKNQRDLLKMNMERAAQGLPPIDIETTGPIIRTEVALPDDVVDKITASAGMNINKILLFTGIGVAAYFLLVRMR